jgi:site-specific recombinase XerD
MERANKALISKQRHPMTMEHQRGGDLYFKSGKDACMSSNLKAFHTYFYSLQENLKKKNPARLKEKKKKKEKRIIELIIKENHCCDLGTERKMRRTLPLGNFQEEEEEEEEERSKFKPCQHDEHLWVDRP